MSPENIKALREQLLMTQLEFSHLLMVDPQTVSKWERKKLRPDARAIVYLFALSECRDSIPPQSFECIRDYLDTRGVLSTWARIVCICESAGRRLP